MRSSGVACRAARRVGWCLVAAARLGGVFVSGCWMVLRNVRTGWALVVALLAAACADDESMVEDATTTTPPPDDTASCPADTPPFEFGPTGLGDTNEELGIKVYLESASAMPPAHDFNDWTIALTDLDGVPLPSAQITWACAFMPLHAHGSNPKAINELGEGRFELQKQNMAMYGGWLIQLWVDPAGGGEPFESSGTSIGTRACAEPGTKPSLEIQTCVPQ
jgi:hypothetical protein